MPAQQSEFLHSPCDLNGNDGSLLSCERGYLLEALATGYSGAVNEREGRNLIPFFRSLRCYSALARARIFGLRLVFLGTTWNIFGFP